MSDPATPVPTPVKVIELQAQHGKFELVLDNPNAKRLTIFMLGDRKRGFLPPQRWVDDFRQTLAKALESKEDRVIVTHPLISVLQVDLPEGPLVVSSISPELDKVRAAALEEAADALEKELVPDPAGMVPQALHQLWLRKRAATLRAS
jgi:hypothetical protein